MVMNILMIIHKQTQVKIPLAVLDYCKFVMSGVNFL